MDAVLNILANDTDDLCLQARNDAAQTCGCRNSFTNSSTFNTTHTSNINKTTTSPANPPKQYVSPCSLCLDASIVPLFPNKTIHLGAFPVNNCDDLTVFAGLLASNDIQCQGLQSLGPYCGCPRPSGACSLCPNGEAVPFPDRFSPLIQGFKGLPSGLVRDLASNLTCGELESIVELPPPSSIGSGIDPALMCLVSQLRSGSCGCSQGWKAKLITWFYRVSAILSLVGSSFIVWNIIHKPSERRTTYHQLVFGMSCFDIITSLAYALTGVLLPPYSGQYQAHGNHATCLLQGFMIQLGETSVFYNLLLAVYFLLLIKYNWKERRFRQYRNYFHLPILAIGVALAGGCLPYIVPQLGFCYIAIPPEYPNRIPISMFFAIPTSLALLLIIICSFVMCYHVYTTERTSRQYSITKRNLALTKKVCWQSLFYCGIFVLTLPILMLNYYVNFRGQVAFYQFLLSALLAPSQGFWNSLIYFQRAHSLQWTRAIFPCLRPSKEQSSIPPRHHSQGQPPSLETSSMEPSQDETGQPRVRRPSTIIGADMLFSAPAAHWMNEELPTRNRRPSISAVPGSKALSFRKFFRVTSAANNAAVDDETSDHGLPEERDWQQNRSVVKSVSESPVSNNFSVWKLQRKTNSVPTTLQDVSEHKASLVLVSAPVELTTAPVERMIATDATDNAAFTAVEVIRQLHDSEGTQSFAF